MLRFTIYDIDSESRNLANHDFLGQMTCSLGEIVTNQARVGLIKRCCADCTVQIAL